MLTDGKAKNYTMENYVELFQQKRRNAELYNMKKLCKILLVSIKNC